MNSTLHKKFLVPVDSEMIFEKYVDKKTVPYILKNKVTEILEKEKNLIIRKILIQSCSQILNNLVSTSIRLKKLRYYK